MELENHWEEIKTVFNSGVTSSKYCAIATINHDGKPHISPIGFIFLKDDYTAFYFEEYTKAMPKNYESNKNVCLMAVNSGFLFWFKSLLKGKFVSGPGVRLYGKAGNLRKALPEEIEAYKSRVKSARILRGYNMIWSELETVREIKLESFEPVVYPKMMEHLWRKA